MLLCICREEGCGSLVLSENIEIFEEGKSGLIFQIFRTRVQVSCLLLKSFYLRSLLSFVMILIG